MPISPAMKPSAILPGFRPAGDSADAAKVFPGFFEKTISDCRLI
jgi:hypothetical protein